MTDQPQQQQQTESSACDDVDDIDPTKIEYHGNGYTGHMTYCGRRLTERDLKALLCTAQRVMDNSAGRCKRCRETK